MSTDRRKSLASNLARIAGDPNKPAEAATMASDVPNASHVKQNRVKPQKWRRIIWSWLMALLLAMLGLLIFAAIFIVITHQQNVVMRELMKLVESGDLREIQGFIAKHPTSVNAQDEFGYTPLIRAVQKKHIDVLKLLLKNGAKASIADRKGFTALGDAQMGLRNCTAEYRSQLARSLKSEGKSEEKIAKEMAAFRKEYSPEDRKKWQEIEAILVEALKKEKSAE